MVDNMEDNNNENLWGGYWYTYDDLGSGGNSYVVPWTDNRASAEGVDPIEFGMSPVTDRPGSTYAARMTGVVTTDFTYGFVGMGTAFIEPKGPINLSDCTGVRFWVKGDGKQYRMKITSSSPLFLDGEGDNHYGYQFLTSGTWVQMDVTMAMMTQELYWGTTVPKADALAMATDIQFQTVGQPHASIDLWVDEIEFYGCSSYPGEVPAGTATNTPIIVPTATNTPPPAGSTATFTPTVTATTDTWTGLTATPTPGDTLAVSEATPVIAFPNPFQPDAVTDQLGRPVTHMGIQFSITQKAKYVTFRLYTAQGRLIREKKYDESMVDRQLNQGTNVLRMERGVFENLANGSYYYIVLVEDENGKQARSKVEHLIILKKGRP